MIEKIQIIKKLKQMKKNNDIHHFNLSGTSL